MGDPDEVTHKLRKLYTDVGGFGKLLLLCHDWEPNIGKWFNSMELMANNVLPRLQDLTPQGA